MIAAQNPAMLKQQLLHPLMNEILGRAGHSAKVLIADGNYPASSTLGPRAELVSLNLAPGIVNCTQVLEALVTAIPIEAAHTMQPESTGPHAMHTEPPIWTNFRQIFRQHGVAVDLQPIERWEFYQTVQLPEHVLTIQTADQRMFANLLLTIGVQKE
jgi:L-fucose mutarotase